MPAQNNKQGVKARAGGRKGKREGGREGSTYRDVTRRLPVACRDEHGRLLVGIQCPA